MAYGDALNLYAGFAWDPVNRRDPDGRDAIYIAFPDFEIAVGDDKLACLGHAGVVFVDESTGSTKYFEYGRYDSNRGEVYYRGPVAELRFDDAGRPTDTSLKKLLHDVAVLGGRGTRIEGAYVPGPDFASMLDFARGREALNGDPERPAYSILNRNCATFARDCIEAGGQSMPSIFDPRPNAYVGRVQAGFERLAYDPSRQSLERGGAYNGCGWLETLERNQGPIREGIEQGVESARASAKSAWDRAMEWFQ